MINKDFLTDTKIAGVTQFNDNSMPIQMILSQLNAGGRVHFIRDYGNKYDANAIKAFSWENQKLTHIGYIQKELAAEIAPFLDSNMNFELEGVILQITGGTDENSYGCNVRVWIQAPDEPSYEEIKSYQESLSAQSQENPSNNTQDNSDDIAAIIAAIILSPIIGFICWFILKIFSLDILAFVAAVGGPALSIYLIYILRKERTAKKQNHQSATSTYNTVQNSANPNQKSIGRFPDKFVIAIVAIVISIALIYISIYFSKDNSTPNANKEKAASHLITLNEYNKLKTGMSRTEVYDIVGSFGTKTSETGHASDDYHIVTYEYEGYGELGANAQLMFINGELDTMAQYGLDYE